MPNETNRTTMGIYGASKVLSKSISNVILQKPLPLFVEDVRSELNRDTTTNLSMKAKDILNRLNDMIGVKADIFFSDICNGMKDVRRSLLK